MGEDINIVYKGKKELLTSKDKFETCYFYGIKPVKKINQLITHYVLVIDVSYNMKDSISKIREGLLEFINELQKKRGNYLTIITYSGHNSNEILINKLRCSKKNYVNHNVNNLIESIVNSEQLSVLSEPLDCIKQFIDESKDDKAKYKIVLLTDGYSIPTDWSISEEKQKCIKLINEINEINISINILGNGRNNNAEFLNELLKEFNFGRYRYLDSIEQLTSNLFSIIKETPFNIGSNLIINNEKLFLVNSSKLLLKSQEAITLNNEELLVTFNEPICVNNIDIKHRNIKVQENNIEKFIYSLSKYYIDINDRDSSTFVNSQIGDICSYYKIINSYSIWEKYVASNFLGACITDRSLRFKHGKINEDIYSDHSEQLCLLEILLLINQDMESYLLWNNDMPYKRIGIKQNPISDRFEFINNDNINKVCDIVIASNKLNIGFKTEILGVVYDNISKLKLDAKIYKDYNIVVNGSINVQEIYCRLSNKTKSLLKNKGVQIKSFKHNGRLISKIDLSNIKVTNAKVLSLLNADEMVRNINDVEILSCRQWALNKLINKIKDDTKASEIELAAYNQEEIDARKKFRVSLLGIYSPILNNENERYKIYKANMFEWKIDKFPTKTYEEIALKNYGINLTNDFESDLSYLNNELLDVKRKKSKLQFQISLVRISYGIMNKDVVSWDNVTEKSKKQTDKVSGQNMVIDEEVKISTKNIDGIVLKQESYSVYTKCN